MLQESDFDDFYYDIILASMHDCFLIARAYPKEGTFVYMINQRGNPTTHRYTYLESAIDTFNEMIKSDI